jgi:hypothetical protein
VPAPRSSSTQVQTTSPDDSIAYGDSRDHFGNGASRLFASSADEFARRRAVAERSGGRDLLSAAAGFREPCPVRPTTTAEALVVADAWWRLTELAGVAPDRVVKTLNG